MTKKDRAKLEVQKVLEDLQAKSKARKIPKTFSISVENWEKLVEFSRQNNTKPSAVINVLLDKLWEGL